MTPAGENVAMMLTPPGVAAIAVMRLAGPSNGAFAAAHLSRPPKVGRCVHAELRDGDDVIDDVVVASTDGGCLDLNLHGGTWVVRSARRLAERFGYRIVDGLEADVISDSPTDPIQKQVLIDLPRAGSHAALKLLTAQPAAWQVMLDTGDRDAMRRALADTALQTALLVPSVAIVGPANVGKSTLANALFGTDRSITADVPGTTRDWVGEPADLDGLVVRLIDTPGVRRTDDAIEAAAIRRASGVIADVACVVVAVDGNRPLDDDGRRLLSAHDHPVIVRTKADRPPRCEAIDNAIDVSAPAGIGLDVLRAAIRRRLGASDMESAHARCWTAAQRDGLRPRLDGPAASI